jgi:ABC-type dipeptide/oligopeptide/nickel transport system permease component
MFLVVPFPAAWIFVFLAECFIFFNTGPSNTILANVTHPAIRAAGFALNIFVIHILGDAISPFLIGVIAGVGGSVRFYRTVMLDEMYHEYVRTARAKGVGPSAVLFNHVLRNAMIPILTNIVVAIPFLYTGALLLENFFGIPGLGRMTVTALFNGDEDVIFADVFIGSILFVFANVMTDIAYTWADPRIRLR